MVLSTFGQNSTPPTNVVSDDFDLSFILTSTSTEGPSKPSCRRESTRRRPRPCRWPGRRDLDPGRRTETVGLDLGTFTDVNHGGSFNCTSFELRVWKKNPSPVMKLGPKIEEKDVPARDPNCHQHRWHQRQGEISKLGHGTRLNGRAFFTWTVDQG